MRVQYVCGFLFDGFGSVALINKLRPAWMLNRLNGIGGHHETGESLEEAMQREFKEEAGVAITGWRKFAVVRSAQDNAKGYEVHWFCRTLDRTERVQLRSTTDEKVSWVPLSVITLPKCMPNLPWLVNMARYIEQDYADVFVIDEVVANRKTKAATA
jgi:ADP-ribose pyrophosphatase YjhB (NUDIX family)